MMTCVQGFIIDNLTSPFALLQNPVGSVAFDLGFGQMSMPSGFAGWSAPLRSVRRARSIYVASPRRMHGKPGAV